MAGNGGQSTDKSPLQKPDSNDYPEKDILDEMNTGDDLLENVAKDLEALANPFTPAGTSDTTNPNPCHSNSVITSSFQHR